MRIVLIFVLLIIFSCNSSNSDQKGINSSIEISKDEVDSANLKNSVPIEQPDDTFEEFFQKFKQDSVFQINRIRFPLKITIIDITENVSQDWMQQQEWNYLDFHYDESFADRKIDAYTQEILINPDSTLLKYRGVDNGIYINYVFYLIDEKWTLISFEDYSN